MSPSSGWPGPGGLHITFLSEQYHAGAGAQTGERGILHARFDLREDVLTH